MDNLYRRGIVERFPLTAQVDIIYVPETGKAHIVPVGNAKALFACNDFLTLTQHAVHFDQQCLPGSGTLDWLRTAADEGMMISWPDLLRGRHSPGPEESSQPQVGWLVIPTANRPGNLLKMVKSYSANIATFGRALSIFISDQSDLPDELSKRELALISRQSGIDVFYAGEIEKKRFATQMMADGNLPPEVVKFALFGWDTSKGNIGANRNATLLQATGSILLSADDDTICQTATVPGTISDLTLSGEIDPNETWFFADRPSAIQFMEPKSADFVEAHEQLLGRDLQSVLPSSGNISGMEFGTMCNHILSHLCGGTGRIFSTYGGLVGDAGFYSAYRFMVLASRQTRDRLTASKGSYQQSTRSREIARQALSPTICHGGPAAGLAAVMGLDNRDLLPPFFPPFLSEDAIFGVMLARCQEGSCIGHVPLSLLHDRPGARSYGSIATIRMSDLIQAALLSCGIPIDDRSCIERLDRFGKHLVYLGNLSPSGFCDWARRASFAKASSIVQSIENRLRREGAHPGYWAEDLALRVEQISTAALNPNYCVPDELLQTGGLQEAREIMRQFGELLRWWPEIVRRTKELAESGVQLGQRINAA